ncbi:MAG: hypothetical protein CXZ00_07815 [Acidobacteria bacterium]|nr:MAG: hypothetical protein CXZ00_07815 [Acidobacteriota bacterium]
MKALITTVFLCVSLGLSVPQASAAKPSRASRHRAYARKAAGAGGRSECVTGVGFCVTVPASWQRLGNVFDDLGFVVAEPHSGTDSAGWPQLTVAIIEVPQSKKADGTAGSAPSLDALVERLLTPGRSFTSVETLQRSHLLVNGADAEIVRVKLHDDSNQPEVIEEIALIQGPEGLVYSLALRCVPQEFARLEPIFQKAAHSWRIKDVAVPAPESKPRDDSEKK